MVYYKLWSLYNWIFQICECSAKLVGFCWRRKGTNFTQDPGITGYYNPLYKVLFFIAQGWISTLTKNTDIHTSETQGPWPRQPKRQCTSSLFGPPFSLQWKKKRSQTADVDTFFLLGKKVSRPSGIRGSKKTTQKEKQWWNFMAKSFWQNDQKEWMWCENGCDVKMDVMIFWPKGEKITCLPKKPS